MSMNIRMAKTIYAITFVVLISSQSNSPAEEAFKPDFEGAWYDYVGYFYTSEKSNGDFLLRTAREGDQARRFRPVAGKDNTYEAADAAAGDHPEHWKSVVRIEFDFDGQGIPRFKGYNSKGRLQMRAGRWFGKREEFVGEFSGYWQSLNEDSASSNLLLTHNLEESFVSRGIPSSLSRGSGRFRNVIEPIGWNVFIDRGSGGPNSTLYTFSNAGTQLLVQNGSRDNPFGTTKDQYHLASTGSWAGEWVSNKGNRSIIRKREDGTYAIPGHGSAWRQVKRGFFRSRNGYAIAGQKSPRDVTRFTILDGGSLESWVREVDTQKPTGIQAKPYNNLSELAKATAPNRIEASVWLNFDGFEQSFSYRKPSGGSPTEISYEMTPLRNYFYDLYAVNWNQNFEKNYDAIVQEVMFRTAEFFAPFNVRIGRLRGKNFADTSHSGSTTVFVGTAARTQGETPQAHADWPRKSVLYNDPNTESMRSHKINSNPYDVAIVSAGRAQTEGTLETIPYILGAICAHEAGHTFGMPHTVDSYGDPGQLGELMSPAKRGGIRPGWMQFVDKEFDIFDENPDVEKIGRVSYGVGDNVYEISKLNPYRFLNTVLKQRNRQGDALASTAVLNSTAKAFRRGESHRLATSTPLNGADYQIDYYGDYDVLEFTAPRAADFRISVTGKTASQRGWVVFAFEGDGIKRRAFSGGDDKSEVSVSCRSGEKLKIVVGGYDCESIGFYTISVNEVKAVNEVK